MRKIKVTKTVEVVFEVDDDYFHDDDFFVDNLVDFVRNSTCQDVTKEEGYPYNEYVFDNDDIKDIKIYKKDSEFLDKKDVEKIITKEEFDKVVKDLEKNETCYECTGYGDDYDDKGNKMCDSCPYNE